MSRARREVEQLEEMVVSGRKKFVRYAEGAQLYSLGLHTFCVFEGKKTGI